MNDTIAAIATAPGQGGVSIVRVSGDDAERILTQVFCPAQKGLTSLPTHLLTYGRVMDGAEPVDECMAVIMRAPRSYTREDVAELQLHGGSYTAQRVLELCLKAGARLAEPGEFTRRAFLNGRIDLSQAEAVMSVIRARGEQAHHAAMNQMLGNASGFVRRISEALYSIQAAAAACIDYPEEISEEEAAGDLAPRCSELADRIEQALDDRSVHIINDGLSVALCGRPNVGKSSLLNALLGEDLAIVTAIPGTTRDMVRGEMSLGGSILHLTDTAGVRETDDPVEALGVARAARAMEQADLTIWVLDGSEPLTDEDRALAARLTGREVLAVLNKADLPPVVTADEVRALLPGVQVLRASAQTDASLTELKAALRERARVRDGLELTQPRHLTAARLAAACLRDAVSALETATVDLASIDLLNAQMHLAQITGDDVEESLLDHVFSQFCVGK